MKKISSKKLKITRERIRELETSTLRKAVGGLPGAATDGDTDCPSEATGCSPTQMGCPTMACAPTHGRCETVPPI